MRRPRSMNSWTKHSNISKESLQRKLPSFGVAPSEMVGKVLTSIRASRMHPTITLHFADRSSFQVRVDGYDPTHPGVPKTIETNPELAPFLAAEGKPDLSYTIANAAVITMTDKAFEKGGKRESSWDQRHAGLAFKFKE